MQSVWTSETAKEFLKSVSDLLQKAGLSARIVGGVAAKGKSEHDLDVLLIPIREDFDLEALIMHFGGWEYVEEGGNPYDPNGSIFEVHLPDGRIVDFITTEPENQASPT